MLASPGLELENDESVFGWFEASLIGWLDWKMMSWLRELDDLVSTNAPSEAFFVENKALRKTCYYGQQLKWNWLQIHLHQTRSKIVWYQKSTQWSGWLRGFNWYHNPRFKPYRAIPKSFLHIFFSPAFCLQVREPQMNDGWNWWAVRQKRASGRAEKIRWDSGNWMMGK